MPDIAFAPDPYKGKNIVICCDGTGNKFIDDPAFRGSNSNVVKLYTTLKIDDNQVGYYHPGVGTAGDPSAKHWLSRKWSLVKGLAFAAGFKDGVLGAYQYLMDTYNDGDRIFLFGFSRGSYTVRALAGLLDGYGLLCKGNQGHLTYAWNEYVAQHADRKQHHIRPNERFKQTFSRKNLRVHFVGVWDTVSSVGWINTPLRLYNVAHNPIIDIGRHAISIDERRCFYRDNLWADVSERKVGGDAAPAAYPKQDLLQVWFAGVHSDVGGSYAQADSALSNVALKWMLTQAEMAGMITKPEMRALVLGEEIAATSDLETEKKIEELRPLYKKPRNSIVHNSLCGVWWLLEFLPHRYYDKDEGEENWRTPLGIRRRIPGGALIHSTVKERIEQGSHGYRPGNLVGGVASLVPVDVSGQTAEELYQYLPRQDPKPQMNEDATRIGVMVLITSLEVATAALMAVALFRGLRLLLNHY